MERIYVHSLNDAAGVVAANNFVSYFMPANSVKFAVALLITVQNYSVNVAAAANSMLVSRITSSTGGTPVAAANIGRFADGDEDPSFAVATGNPTVVTTRAPLVGYPPPISGAGGTGSTSVQSSPGNGSFIMGPGQGLVVYTTAGDVDQRWNIQLIWQEFYL